MSRAPTKIYWHHNLFMHFGSGWSVCIILRLLPLYEWTQWHGTRVRPTYKKHETRRLGPLSIEWFDRRTPWPTYEEALAELNAMRAQGGRASEQD